MSRKDKQSTPTPEDITSNHSDSGLSYTTSTIEKNLLSREVGKEGDDSDFLGINGDNNNDKRVMILSFGHSAYKVEMDTGIIRTVLLKTGNKKAVSNLDIQPFIGMEDETSGALYEAESSRTIDSPRSSITLFGKHQLESGVHIIDGAPETGKTTLMASIASELTELDIKTEFIRFSEPDAINVQMGSELVRFAPISHEPTFLTRMAAALLSDAKVIQGDSLKRYMFTGSGGATGKGGVQMGIFDYLSAWSALAVELDKIIIFTTNPLSNAADTDFMASYKVALSGSVEGVIMLTGQGRCTAISRSTRVWNNYDFQLKNRIISTSLANDGVPTDQVCYIPGTTSMRDFISQKRRISQRLKD